MSLPTDQKITPQESAAARIAAAEIAAALEVDARLTGPARAIHARDEVYPLAQRHWQLFQDLHSRVVQSVWNSLFLSLRAYGVSETRAAEIANKDSAEIARLHHAPDLVETCMREGWEHCLGAAGEIANLLQWAAAMHRGPGGCATPDARPEPPPAQTS
jgi:hypothetical protein